MTKFVGIALLLIGSATAILAMVAPAPEVDAGSAASAFAFLAGAVLVIRGRRKA